MKVVGVSSVGGVVGYMAGGAVDHSDNKGAVRGGESVGGIIGYLAGGGFYASRNLGGVNGAYKVGAMVGSEGNPASIPDLGNGGAIGSR
jgi:hypothetical protein